MPERHFIEQLSGVTPRRDPAWAEAKRRLWAMTADERRAAMYAGTLSFRLCLHWANHAPHEVPELNGELWFIAIRTPEVADATASDTAVSPRNASMPALAQPDPVHAALAYAARGWPVLPLQTPDTDGCSCGRAECPSAGKHPRTRHGVTDATIDAERIRRWWAAWPAANLGLATGSPLIVIDVDGDRGRATLRELQREAEALPGTLAAITGRGVHLYFMHAGGLGNSTGRLGAGLDVRGEGGYIVAPPSRHSDGVCYQWANGLPPAQLPAWIADTLAPHLDATATAATPPTGTPRHDRYLEAAIRGELTRIASAQPGTRNNTLNRSAFRLGQLAGNAADQLEHALLTAALASGLETCEARATIASALRAGRQHPRR